VRSIVLREVEMGVLLMADEALGSEGGEAGMKNDCLMLTSCSDLGWACIGREEGTAEDVPEYRLRLLYTIQSTL
jgi:hypothetical protein